MSNIYITSDWHFNHDKPFLYEPRGFSSIYKMNEAIIKNHNEIVNSEDDVFCLGDCMLGDNEEGLKLIKQLKGKIHIILGNHCTNTRAELYETCYNVVDIAFAGRLNYMGYHFYLTHYPTLIGNYDEDKPLKKQMINLCGHSHTIDPFYHWELGKIFHTEMDTNNCYPWRLDEIINKILKKVGK